MDHSQLLNLRVQPQSSLVVGLKPLAAALCGLSITAVAHAQDADGVFRLGTVTVTAKKSNANSEETIVDKKSLQAQDLDTVSAAVNATAGASLSKNSRNEDLISIRGFDPRQVPVFVDGIPLYVPYDGYVDFARFTTFDLSEVRVAKGAASLLYGPNALGGTINLVTRKPVKAFEGDVRLGVASGAEHKVAVNLGGNQGLWYYQLGASYFDANSFPLPRGFKDRKGNPTDTGDYRHNADREDTRYSFKLGLTPNANDEYAIGYVRQQGEKGNPSYTGALTGGMANRRWRWPYWDKDSLYLISNTRIGSDHALKVRLYQDDYKNGLFSYTDNSYSSQVISTSFPSYYDDKTYGASVELTSYALSGHEISAVVHYKDDRHEDSNPRSVTKEYRDTTLSFAIEDVIRFNDAWSARIGFSHDVRDAKKVYEWPTGSASANNGLLELTHAFSQDTSIYASASRKTRFPTIKDRYSARMGAALPSPDLKPEKANHFELGLRSNPWQGGETKVAVFYSRINDLMQSQTVDSTECGGTTCQQAQNVGRARHTGIELTLQQRLGDQLSAGVNYTYLSRSNLSDRGVILTDTPRQRLYAHLTWSFNEQVRALATLEAEKGRRAAYGTGKYITLGGFATVGAKAVWDVRKDTTVEVGVRNLGDKYYELSEGFPMPGRTWFANASYRF